MGGAERWLIAMASQLPHVSREVGTRPIRISGVIVAHPSDKDTFRELSQFTRVIVQRPGGDSQHDVDSLVQAADATVIGGFLDIRPFVRATRGPVVMIAHGACSMTTAIAQNAFDSKLATHYTAVSQVSRSIFPTHMRDRVTVIENGAEIDRTTPLRGRDAVRAQWGIKPGQKVIGYVGRFGPDKRSEALGEAIARLPSEYVGVLVGNAEQETEAVQACQALAPGRIIVGGRYRQVGEALAGLDCWINCSPSEGFCLSRIEASLAGVPVVSTPTGDIPRLEAEHGQLVWTVPIGASGEIIARAIQSCFRSPVDTATVVERSRALSLARYTTSAMAARWTDYLHSIIPTQ
jgi:glycosyltransferase involved in cell wall biosynthesis